MIVKTGTNVMHALRHLQICFRKLSDRITITKNLKSTIVRVRARQLYVLPLQRRRTIIFMARERYSIITSRAPIIIPNSVQRLLFRATILQAHFLSQLHSSCLYSCLPFSISVTVLFFCHTTTIIIDH